MAFKPLRENPSLLYQHQISLSNDTEIYLKINGREVNIYIHFNSLIVDFLEEYLQYLKTACGSLWFMLWLEVRLAVVRIVFLYMIISRTDERENIEDKLSVTIFTRRFFGAPPLFISRKSHTCQNCVVERSNYRWLLSTECKRQASACFVLCVGWLWFYIWHTKKPGF